VPVEGLGVHIGGVPRRVSPADVQEVVCLAQLEGDEKVVSEARMQARGMWYNLAVNPELASLHCHA
jgi:hypothetical protein